MKILGISENGKYIAEITHTEIEQYLDLYYGKLEKLRVGEEIDLGDGYKHYENTRRALEKTQDFFKSNINNINAITNAMLLNAKKETTTCGKMNN